MTAAAFSLPMWSCEPPQQSNSLVQPCVVQCVGSEECLSSTRVDSRWPRHTASSSGVRPLGSRRSTSCCRSKHKSSNQRNAVRPDKRICKRPKKKKKERKKEKHTKRHPSSSIQLQNKPPRSPRSSAALDPAPDTDCSTPEDAEETLPQPWLSSAWQLHRSKAMFVKKKKKKKNWLLQPTDCGDTTVVTSAVIGTAV